MTLQEVYRGGRRALTAAGIENASFEAVCLFERRFGMDRQALILEGFRQADPEAEELFNKDIGERVSGRPLQYILGFWDFMSLRLAVHEGVLIPRPETELLVEQSACLLRGAPHAKVLDLCGGTGAVAFGLSSLLPDIRIESVELSDAAIACMHENKERLHMDNVTLTKADVLAGPDPKSAGTVRAILSNPPYIPSGEIPHLQAEVRHEPRMALDGGNDGLVFYRAIAERWLPCVQPGGFIAVEIGIGQEQAVPRIFRSAGLSTECFEDYNGIPRVVVGRVRQRELNA